MGTQDIGVADSGVKLGISPAYVNYQRFLEFTNLLLFDGAAAYIQILPIVFPF
jgi:hypothetical protein